MESIFQNATNLIDKVRSVNTTIQTEIPFVIGEIIKLTTPS